LPFLDEHPIIRPLEDYAAVVRRAIHRQDGRSSMSEGFLRHGRTMEGPYSPENEASLGSNHSQGSRDIPPSRSGYPSSSCSSAELDSVSPDPSSIVPDSPSHQQDSRHE
jgi:hypothetical protein